MESYIALTIILSLTLLLLAFMAIFIEIGVEWPEGSKFPKINITFKKDKSLFDFLKSSKSKGWKRKGEDVEDDKGRNGVTQEEPMDYIEKCLFGTAIIKYGEKAETVCTREFTIKALKDDVDKYYYRNSDSGARIKCISGFLNPNKDFVRIQDFNSWNSTSGNGAFVGTHKIILPLKGMKKDEEKSLIYETRLKINYQEMLAGADMVSHGFYFRMGTNNYGAVLLFQIPNGKISKLCKFDLQVLDKGRTLFRKEINTITNFILSLDCQYGNVWIKEGQKAISVTWNIPTVLKRGIICRLDWYNKRNKR